MNILDLNHIEAVEGNEVVGGGFFFFPPTLGSSTKFNQTVFTTLDQFNIQTSDVLGIGVAVGNSATADAQATALGNDSFTSGTTFTATTSGSSASKAVSNSVSD